MKVKRGRTADELDPLAPQERLDQVEHARELREDDRLLAVAPLLRDPEQLHDHPRLARVRRQVRVRVRRRLLRLPVQVLAVHAHVVLPHIILRQRPLAHRARTAEAHAREHVREVVPLFVLRRAFRLDRLAVALVVLGDQGGVVARLPETQQKDEDGGVGLVDVALLELLEAALHLLLDRVVKLPLDLVERALDDVHQSCREVKYRLAVHNRRLSPPKHNHAEDDLSSTEA